MLYYSINCILCQMFNMFVFRHRQIIRAYHQGYLIFRLGSATRKSNSSPSSSICIPFVQRPCSINTNSPGCNQLMSIQQHILLPNGSNSRLRHLQLYQRGNYSTFEYSFLYQYFLPIFYFLRTYFTFCYVHVLLFCIFN